MESKENPKVTIGMPTFNRVNTVERSIKDVLAQSFSNYELIIYDDGSTDGTKDIVSKFEDERITFVTKTNLGPPHPLNEILTRSKGEYIIILHDHDFFNSELIKLSVEALDKNPNAGFVLQGSAWIDEDGKSKYQEMLLDLPYLNDGKAQGKKQLSNKEKFSSIFHACSMCRRSALEEVGMYYDTTFNLYADTDLWLRLISKFDFIYLHEVLMTFRTRESNGHFLNKRQFEILDWQASIANKNARSFFNNNELSNIHNLIEKKKRKQILRLTLQAATRNHNDVFLLGAKKIIYDSGQIFFIRTIFYLIIRSDFISNTILRTLKHLNQIRKKVSFISKSAN